MMRSALSDKSRRWSEPQSEGVKLLLLRRRKTQISYYELMLTQFVRKGKKTRSLRTQQWSIWASWFIPVPVWVDESLSVRWLVFGPISVFWPLAPVPKANSALAPPVAASGCSVFGKLGCSVFCQILPQPLPLAGSLHSITPITSSPNPNLSFPPPSPRLSLRSPSPALCGSSKGSGSDSGSIKEYLAAM